MWIYIDRETVQEYYYLEKADGGKPGGRVV